MGDFTLTPEQLTGLIDHAILRPDLTRADLEQELYKAHKYRVFSVCVRPVNVREAVQFLNNLNSTTQVGTVIGFPHGSQHVEAKSIEIVIAANDGATEVDIVTDIGLVKELNSNPQAAEWLLEEYQTLNAVAKENGLLTKLILETAYLNEYQIREASRLGAEAGFDFIKTSTGYASEGATIKNLETMKQAVEGRSELKASGGVNSIEKVYEMLELGVTRFGTSQTEKLVQQLNELSTTGKTETVINADEY